MNDNNNIWTAVTATNDNIRISASANLSPTDFEPTVTFDREGRLTSFQVFATVQHVDHMSFIATRGTATIHRDVFGRITRYSATGDFGSEYAEADSRQGIVNAFASVVALELAANIRKDTVAA